MMMKRFQYKSRQVNNQQKARSRAIKSVVAVIVVLGFLSFALPNLLTGVLHEVAQPIWKFKTNVVDKSLMASVVGYFSSKSALLDDNRDLKKSLLKSERDLIELSLIKSENERLRKALGMRNPNDDSIFVEILSKPNKTLYDTLILNAGINDGVRVGDLIRFEDSIIIGEIIRVQSKTSNARMFSSPGVTLDAVIADSIGTIVEGMGGGNFRIELPRDIIVKEGMSVRLSQFPRTLIGFIDAIHKENSDSFQQVFVRSPVNLAEVGYVFVVHITE